MRVVRDLYLDDFRKQIKENSLRLSEDKPGRKQGGEDKYTRNPLACSMEQPRVKRVDVKTQGKRKRGQF